ncbi:hypothetical protein BM221_007516 [Beauveria bassiana]|uniref:Uncharacterized protein n=1 Tax=Beauveria bassiana TaxID=176275 RepID=A0A2N6NH06_BEABA|nr:hypothetical protein BM221_007516 [Beauveria bassiana]
MSPLPASPTAVLLLLYAPLSATPELLALRRRHEKDGLFGPRTLHSDVISEFSSKRRLHLLKDSFQRLHLFQNSIGVARVHLRQFEQGSREEVTVRDFVVNVFQLYALNLPNVTGYE